MTPEQEPAKKIAKRVVKKRIVKRPVSNRLAPTVRYGRLSHTPAKAPGGTQTKARPAAKAASPKKPVAAPKRPHDLGKKAGAAGRAAGKQTGKAASVVVGGVKGASSKVGTSTVAAFGKVRAYRLPRLEQTRASAIVGVLVGLITVGLAALFAMLFSELRGTSTGGGSWGSLTVVVIAFIAFAAGELLLALLHVRQPRVTSFLGVCLTLFAIMAFFLTLVNGPWAWLIVPLLGAATYPIAHRAIAAADASRTQPQ